MSKKWFQRAVTAAIILLLAVCQCATGFADEWDSGTPGLIVGGDGVYEVEAGETTRLSIQLKNTGAGTAENVTVRANGAAGIIPYRLSLSGGGNIGDIGVNAYKELKLTVTMDAMVEEASYPVTLEYTYNGGNNHYSGSGTIYLKVKGFGQEPDFLLDRTTLTPESLSPGETAQLSGCVVNRGAQEMHQVELSLGNLTAEGISLVSGFGTKTASQIPIGGEMPFQFPLAASADMAAGNYPVTFQLKYRDGNGKEYEKTQDFYVNVGGVAGKKADLEIRNMNEPGGTYGVNQNFTVSFDLYNAGETTAKSISITAEPVDAAAVVPKSSSRRTLKELAPGASAPFSFQFAGTAASTSQNYAIQFTVEYTSGGTATTSFKQFAGVNVSNPDKDDEENTSKPKIIVSNYVSDPLIVMAGDEFDLTMTLMNTHKEKAVKNIKMFLTLAEETSSETEKSGNIFTPVNSSNTFYFDSIGPKSTVDKSLRLYVVPDAQPKTYTLTVNFEYEDGNGTEYTAQELLGINVKQVTQLQIDEFTIPDMAEVYEPITVSFSYYNTGKVTLNNVMIKVEGNVDCQNKSTYIGNMESGYSDYFETTFSAMEPGETPVAIVVSYEDPSGETIEERRELTFTATEPMMMDEEMEPENPPLDLGQIAKYIGILAILAVALVFFVKKQKEEPKSNAESMNSDDLEDDDEDNEFDEFDDEETSAHDEDDKEGMPL